MEKISSANFGNNTKQHLGFIFDISNSGSLEVREKRKDLLEEYTSQQHHRQPFNRGLTKTKTTKKSKDHDYDEEKASTIKSQNNTTKLISNIIKKANEICSTIRLFR